MNKITAIFYGFILFQFTQLENDMELSANKRSNLRDLKIHFNEEAVVVMTTQHVPIQLKIVASLGKTFNFCQRLNKSSTVDAFVCMNKIITSCNNYVDLFNANHHFSTLKKQILDGSFVYAKPTAAQSYILDLMDQVSKFLQKNPNIIVVSSDKGDKIVIMDKDDYFRRMKIYLDENVASGNYEIITDTLQLIRQRIEHSYSETIEIINPYLLSDSSIKSPLTIEPFLIPLLYGCPKIHKKDVPMRLIVSSTDMIGSFLSGWLLKKLQIIASELNKYNILNTEKLIPQLKNFKLEPGHKLFSLDYASMFTNVDIAKTCAIILEYYHLVAKTTSVPSFIFISCLKFFITEATFFMFNGNIFNKSWDLLWGTN